MVTLPPLLDESTLNASLTNKFSEPIRYPIEPVGKFFLHHAQRTLRNHTWSEFEKIQAEQNVKQVEDSIIDPDELLFDSELADETLLVHEARDWKSADLYAAMGLSKLRYKATGAQIVKAHRKQVLKYHPDKKSAAGASLEEDGFFKIIQKAYETLTDPTKRTQYDSCDFNADVIPPKKNTKYDFYATWGPVFESEARFSKKQPIPCLGDEKSSKEEVEKFYNFWHRFDSWRTFEFLDEEVPDDSSNRDHKRYIEKKNKAARDKKKTADNARLVKLVERAMSEDPRIKAFKESEKKEKERKKWEREAGARAEAEAKAKAEAEAEAKEAAKMGKKKAKEAAKSAKKKNKRTIRNVPKEVGYFGDVGNANIIEEQTSLIVDLLDDESLDDIANKIRADLSPISVKTILSETAKTLSDAGKLPPSMLTYFL